MDSRRLSAWALGCHVLASAALLGTLGSSPVWAQTADSGVASAQAVGTAFLKAVQAADWKAAAAFLDIVPLDHYRLQYIDMARRTRRSAGPTVEQLMRNDSLMPRAAAEYQVQRMKIQSQKYNFLEHEFGVSDPDSLAAMPATVVAEHWLEVHDPRWAFRQAEKRSGCPVSAADTVLPKPNFRVLGTIVDGATAFVLYERDDNPTVGLDEVRSSGPPTLVLRRRVDTWWVIPHYDLSGGMAVGVSCQPLATKK